MRFGTFVGVVLVLAVLAGVVTFAFYSTSTQGGSLDSRWISDTAVPIKGNHHGVAAGRFNGTSLVFAPVSGQHNTTQCALITLNGSTGDPVWRHKVPPDDCWIHSVATVTLGDYDSDGVREVISPTAENKVYAFTPRTGKVKLQHNLSSYGYTPAAMGHLTNGSREQIAVVDANGTVFVLYPDGSTAWTRHQKSFVWASPAISNFTDAPGNELAVGFGKGVVTVFRSNGDVAWNTSAPFDNSITWMGTGDTNGDGHTDVVLGTVGGKVVTLDGRTGDVLWQRSVGAYAAVDAVGDGNGDGQTEVYAVAKDGKLRALNASNGDVEWTTTLTSADVQMTPPPVLGDVDGDGNPELVAVTNDGVVSVVDPTSGSVLASYERKVPIWERATVADTNGDGAGEIYVMYGDGRVASLSYHAGS